MRAAQTLALCLLAVALPASSSPINTTPKHGIKEKFKEFLRKVVYGITPTTIYTTLRPNKFPEEYDPIKLLDWQLREEKKKGITTPDWEPRLTEVTPLWDGYFNDPTFDQLTLYCMRHFYMNDSMPTTVKRYWEPEYGNTESLEAIARYWEREALKENSEWFATLETTQYVPMEHLTLEGGVRFSPYWDSRMDSDERRCLTEVQRMQDEKYERELAPYNYNYSPRSPEKTREPPTPPPTLENGQTIKPSRTPMYPGVELQSESVEMSVDAVPRVPRSELERRKGKTENNSS